jgi:Berberine and berberine like
MRVWRYGAYRNSDTKTLYRRPYTQRGSDEAQAYVDENYQGNLARLQAVKRKYDPGSLFRLNANMKPTT